MCPLLIGLLGLGLLKAANAEVRRFERAAAQEIAAQLSGNEKQVAVQAKVGPEGLFGDVFQVTIRARDFSADGLPLFAEPWRSTRGRVGTLRIELDSFMLRDLRIQRLRAEIPNCRFDLPLALRRRQIRLSRSGVGTGEVEVTAADLERFILRKYPEIKRVQVRIDRDKVWVDGYGEFLILATDFSVIAKIEPQDGDKLVLSHARISLNNRVADDFTRDTLLRTLNPVVNLNSDLRLYGAIQVERITLRDGLLRASGPTKIPVRPSGTEAPDATLE